MFLDDVGEFNGPIIFVPGSHADRLALASRRDDHRSDQHLDPGDIALSQADMARLVDRHGRLPGPSAGLTARSAAGAGAGVGQQPVRHEAVEHPVKGSFVRGMRDAGRADIEVLGARPWPGVVLRQPAQDAAG